MTREEEIRHNAYQFGEDATNLPNNVKNDDFMVKVAIKNAFAAGAHWADATNIDWFWKWLEETCSKYSIHHNELEILKQSLKNRMEL